MEERYAEGVAIHGGPELCIGVREGVGEALTGAGGRASYLPCVNRPGREERYSMSFTDDEIAYLRSQPLARLATLSDGGQPDVVPLAF